MNSNRRNKKKQKEQKKIKYNISEDTALRINKLFFQHFNFNYWQHKINALYEYVEKPEKIKTEIRYENDKDLDESIIENFKLEIHMTVFHSAETLFLVILGNLYEPKSVPIWISRCNPERQKELINQLAEQGLDGFIKNADEWLQNLLYPAIDPKHSSYDHAKLSTKFIQKYLKRLAQEYIDHVEYNSYKHGFRCNAGQSGFQLFDDKTQKIMLSSKSDAIMFLELEKIKKGNEIRYNIKESSKTYDVQRDAGIISTTTQILHNIFDYRQLVIKREIVGSDCKIMFAPYFYKSDDPSKIFQFENKNSLGGFVTRFSMSVP